MSEDFQEELREIQRRHTELMAKDLWIIEDVALYMSRSVPAIRRMRDLSHLPPACQVGKRLYWNRVRFMAWVESQEEADDYEPGPPPKRLS